MLKKQLLVEVKRALTFRSLLIWLSIIVILPAVRFYIINDGYQFYKPIEVFQETVSAFVPLLFPALAIIIYLPSFLQEQKNNFIKYTQPRIPLNTYILSKGIINAFLTGIVIFLLVFFTFIFVVYIEPHLGIIYYTPIDENAFIPTYTFSSVLAYGDLVYGFTYAIWVSINAVLYSSIAFMLLLILDNPFVALSVPFVFYHVFNFITGVLNVAQFSPLSTIFPFNIEEQPYWTVMVPFCFLLIILIGICSFVLKKRKDWVV
jgi:hypothetical protein